MIPRATVQAPIIKADSVMVCTLFLKPPQEVMINPPAIIPSEKVISMAVSRQTSPPKLRATCKVLKKLPVRPGKRKRRKR